MGAGGAQARLSSSSQLYRCTKSLPTTTHNLLPDSSSPLPHVSGRIFRTWLGVPMNPQADTNLEPGHRQVSLANRPVCMLSSVQLSKCCETPLCINTGHIPAHSLGSLG